MDRCRVIRKWKKEAAEAGKALKEVGYDFDICYTSYLKRAVHTLNYVLDEMDLNWIPVIKTWRRSYDVAPPLLERDDDRNPRLQNQYRQEQAEQLPLGESLKDTIERVIPYYEKKIKKDMMDGKRVIIAAHGNSLRALVQYIEGLSKEEILELNIPTGIPLVYELDERGNYLSKKYIGDQDMIAAKINAVAKQGSKHQEV